MKILMSIHQEHLENIKKNIKKYEFRKVEAKKLDEKEIILYVTFPVSKIIGIIEIEKIHIDTPKKIWKLTKKNAGINKKLYFDYFKNKEKAIAYEIKKFKEFEKPRELSEYKITHPPQSFIYINI